jgi:hypothetical protein
MNERRPKIKSCNYFWDCSLKMFKKLFYNLHLVYNTTSNISVGVVLRPTIIFNFGGIVVFGSFYKT